MRAWESTGERSKSIAACLLLLEGSVRGYKNVFVTALPSEAETVSYLQNT